MRMEMIMRGKSLEETGNQNQLAAGCRRVLLTVEQIIAAVLSFRKTQASKDNALCVEEKLSLGPKKILYLVSCREKEFLIAAGSDAIVSVVEVSSKMPVQVTSLKKASLSRMQKRERLS
jgi:hypothetical protein